MCNLSALQLQRYLESHDHLYRPDLQGLTKQQRLVRLVEDQLQTGVTFMNTADRRIENLLPILIDGALNSLSILSLCNTKAMSAFIVDGPPAFIDPVMLVLRGNAMLNAVAQLKALKSTGLKVVAEHALASLSLYVRQYWDLREAGMPTLQDAMYRTLVNQPSLAHAWYHTEAMQDSSYVADRLRLVT